MTTRIQKWPLAALWMRAVANECGYTPEVAKPLGAAYAMARRRPKQYEAEVVEGHLGFAGLWFLEPEEGRVCTNGESFRAKDYDVLVLVRFPDLHTHQGLLYVAIDSADQFPIEVLDQTDRPWQRFEAALAGRRSLTVGVAMELLDGLQP